MNKVLWENIRFQLIETVGSNFLVYDKMLTKPVIEIATGNSQMNKLMGLTCLKMMGGDKELLRIAMELEKEVSTL